MTDTICWQPEDVLGHKPYCVSPTHSLTSYCSADESEPQTMLGLASTAWLADHPNAGDGGVIPLINMGQALRADVRRRRDGMSEGFVLAIIANGDACEYVTWNVWLEPGADKYVCSNGNYHLGNYDAAVQDYDRRRGVATEVTV